jgi:hypothetical protein
MGHLLHRVRCRRNKFRPGPGCLPFGPIAASQPYAAQGEKAVQHMVNRLSGAAPVFRQERPDNVPGRIVAVPLSDSGCSPSYLIRSLHMASTRRLPPPQRPGAFRDPHTDVSPPTRRPGTLLAAEREPTSGPTLLPTYPAWPNTPTPASSSAGPRATPPALSGFRTTAPGLPVYSGHRDAACSAVETTAPPAR